MGALSYRFPEIIRTERIGQGLTQTEFANLLGMHQQSIVKYELGEMNPKLSVAEKLLDKLGYEIVIIPKGAKA